jgi:hypothetical protein
MKTLTLKYKAWNQVHYFLPLSGTPLYGSKPEPLDRASIRTLEAFNRSGICSDWWKKGVEQSGKVMEAMERIRKEVTGCELRVKKTFRISDCGFRIEKSISDCGLKKGSVISRSEATRNLTS